MRAARPIIDDPTSEATDGGWRLVTDRVMGGVSEGRLARGLTRLGRGMSDVCTSARPTT